MSKPIFNGVAIAHMRTLATPTHLYYSDLNVIIIIFLETYCHCSRRIERWPRYVDTFGWLFTFVQHLFLLVSDL